MSKEEILKQKIAETDLSPEEKNAIFPTLLKVLEREPEGLIALIENHSDFLKQVATLSALKARYRDSEANLEEVLEADQNLIDQFS